MDSLTLLYDCKTKVLQRFFIAKNNKQKHRFLHVPRNGGEIYIFDMGKPVKIVDLAKRMISLSGRTDVKIEFTGLRHGEKLYEELLNVKELTKPTYHDKIMIATVREYDYDEVKERIQNLIEMSYTYDQMKIVAAMKDIVPEFVSKNSCFEALDKKN